MRTTICGLTLAALAVSAPAAQAQMASPSRFAGNLSGMVAQPVGEFDDYVDVGFGLGGNFRILLDRAGITSLRFDLGFVNYGRETIEVCVASCRILADLTTTNNIVSGHAGLQIGAPAGPVRPYVNGGVGFSYFFTQSSIEGSNDQQPFANTTNFDDGAFSWSGGGGLAIPVSSGATPVSIDLGARYIYNGQVDYLTEDGIADRPDGSIDLFPTRSAAHLVTYMIGVSIAFGGGR